MYDFNIHRSCGVGFCGASKKKNGIKHLEPLKVLIKQSYNPTAATTAAYFFFAIEMLLHF